jgi:hypothetical protein
MELAKILVPRCVFYITTNPTASWFAPLAKMEEPNGHASMATRRNHPRHGVTIGLDRRSSFAGVGVGVDPPIGIGPASACPAAILIIASLGLSSARGAL